MLELGHAQESQRANDSAPRDGRRKQCALERGLDAAPPRAGSEPRVSKNRKLIDAAGAAPAEPLMLCDESSSFGTELFIFGGVWP